MGLLSGISSLSGGIGALDSIVNTFFPKQIIINIAGDQFVKASKIPIDACESISDQTSIVSSDQPAEDGKTYSQNIYVNPESFSLTCIFSNILRFSNVDSLAGAAKFGAALLIPQVASITNILLNEEDSIVTRLKALRDAMKHGSIVQILGLPDKDTLNLKITDITDNQTVQTGGRSRAFNINLKEVFISDLAAAKKSGGRFSKVTEFFGGTLAQGVSNTSGASLIK